MAFSHKKIHQLFSHYNRIFSSTILNTEDIYTLNKQINDLIQEIIQIEKHHNLNGSYSLGDRLVNIHDSLCRKGLLPRSFENHILPYYTRDLLIARFGATIHTHRFINRRINLAQIRFIQTLALQIQLTCDESQLQHVFINSLYAAKHFDSSNPSSSLFATHLLSKWIEDEIKNAEKNGYFKKPLLMGENFVQDYMLLSATETQIALKRQSFDEQHKQNKQLNDDAFAKLERVNFELPVNQYIAKYKENLQEIHQNNQKRIQDCQIGIKFALESYTRFWHDLAVSIKIQIDMQTESFIKRQYILVQSHIIEARQFLESKGILTTCYMTDQKYIILNRLETTLQNNYFSRFKKVNRKRIARLNELRNELMLSKNEKEAAQLIHEAAYEINKDHKISSTAFNIVFLRKSSRAANTLDNLLSSLERDNLIPVLDISDGVVLKNLKITLKNYFESDIFKNNLSRRHIAENLLDEIRAIEKKENNGYIHSAYSKQLKWEAFEKSIQDAHLLHEQGEGITRIYRKIFKTTTKSRLVEHLESLRNRLSSGLCPQISALYLHTKWPIIKIRLESAILDFESDNSSNINAIDKNSAIEHVRDLLNQLRIAGDEDIANGILQVCINHMRREDFYAPQLATILFTLHQNLQKEGVLPVIPLTEYSQASQEHINKTIKNILKKKEALKSWYQENKDLSSPPTILNSTLNKPMGAVYRLHST